jgi:hypothetical protein
MHAIKGDSIIPTLAINFEPHNMFELDIFRKQDVFRLFYKPCIFPNATVREKFWHGTVLTGFNSIKGKLDNGNQKKVSYRAFTQYANGEIRWRFPPDITSGYYKTNH